MKSTHSKEADLSNITAVIFDTDGVLDWIVKHCQNRAEAIETLIGYIPATVALDMKGLDLGNELMGSLLSISTGD